MRILLFTTFLLFTFNTLQADGIKFFKGTLEEALIEAKNNDQLVFIDAYTTWCGPCKAMSKMVFPDTRVGEFYNENFVNLKLDMEKGNGPAFARKYKVRAYPSLLFLDGDGKVVHRAKGGRQIAQFIDLGKFALSKLDNSEKYATAYEEGDRSPELLKKYAYSLLRAKKPHLKVANEFLMTRPDLKKEENLKALFDFATEVDSRIFGLMMKHKSAMMSFKSQNDFDKKIERAGYKTVRKAVEFKNESLLKEAKATVKKYAPKKATEFQIVADLKYAKGTRNTSKYLKASKKYVKAIAKNNATELHSMANQALKDFPTPAILGTAVKWSGVAVKNGGKAEYFYTHAQILNKLGKKDQAIIYAKEGLSLAKKEKMPTIAFDKLIQTLES